MQIIQVYQTEKQEIKKTAMKVLEKIASLLHTGINHNDKLWWNFFFLSSFPSSSSSTSIYIKG